MNILSELIKVSNRYGANSELVLAGGGNTSYKNEEHLYVKGSGTTLAAITESGFVKMNRAKLNAMLTREYSSDSKQRENEVLADLMAAREAAEINKRPSVETLLHHLFKYSLVVHTHPAIVNGLTCGKNGKEEASKLFGNRALWIDLCEPGYILSSVVKKAMDEYRENNGRDADIVLLQNHGIFVAGNSEKEIDDKYALVIDKIKASLKTIPSFDQTEFDRERAAFLAPAIRMMCKANIVSFCTNSAFIPFLKNEQAFLPLSSVYTPDHMVYYKRAPLFVKSSENIDEQYNLIAEGIKSFEEKYSFLPQIIAIEGLGFYAIAASKKQADIKISLFLDTVKIALYTQSFGGELFMSDYMIDFIANWEAESYRQGVGLSADTKRISEKISIVTGAAQGFGLGLANEMLKQGANVIIADLNVSLASENAQKFTDEFGEGYAKALEVNVGDEESVKNMVYDCVLMYGGLDVFVSNAGVLRAGALEELDLKSFEFVTKINYTAYFICVKYASRIMKIQHRFNSGYTMDIIQINSKSGLTGSNKNFAYAGGKFGGIGLTQSFAMELVEYNIKVNSICPGNLMSGPLWLDPEKGLFVQYLNAGKVKGAKTIEDVKKFYEAKVPMNRGCEIIDVARALFYVIEQQYETGQAIPVTGGQNMLK